MDYDIQSVRYEKSKNLKQLAATNSGGVSNSTSSNANNSSAIINASNKPPIGKLMTTQSASGLLKNVNQAYSANSSPLAGKNNNNSFHNIMAVHHNNSNNNNNSNSTGSFRSTMANNLNMSTLKNYSLFAKRQGFASKREFSKSHEVSSKKTLCCDLVFHLTVLHLPFQ